MEQSVEELMAERQRLADLHDEARARWEVHQPEFAVHMRAVVEGLERIGAQLMRLPGAPINELSRTQMWLGDALFDLAQGRHQSFEGAIAVYRAADPYVRLAHDALLSAKYDANFANILLRADPSIAVLEEVVGRYKRALPLLQQLAPQLAPRLEPELARAELLLSQQRELAAQMEQRAHDARGLLALVPGWALDEATVGEVSRLIEELAQREATGEIAAALHALERTREIFLRLMELIQSNRGRKEHGISELVMKLWAELTSTLMTPQIDREARERALELQNRLLLAKSAYEGTREPSGSARTFSRQLLPIAQEARAFLYRNQLTFCSPLWPVAPTPALAHGIYVSDGPLREELASVVLARDLEVLRESSGRELAEARFDALRRAAVMIADVSNQALLPAACYEIGIALVLGKPIVVVARASDALPFDIDIQPLAYTGDASGRERLLADVERALLLPQRAPDSGSLRELANVARTVFRERPADVDELVRSVDAPLRAASVLENVVRANAMEGGQRHLVVRTAWFRRYAPPDRRGLFHVMPFRPDWANEMRRRTQAVCEQQGVGYRRGDEASDARVVRAIWDDLCVASHVLVDLTGFNPNVCLELGIAHALGKDTLIVSETGAAGLFPMLGKVRVAPYQRGGDGYEGSVMAFLETA